MKAWRVLTLSIWMCVLLAGCNKKLTPDRAKALVQKRADEVNGGLISTDIRSVTLRLNERTPDAPERLSKAMQRLVQTGYLDKQTFKVLYPDLTGTYEG